MLAISKSETVKDEEIEDQRTGNDQRTDVGDNQQLRQLLVNGQVDRSKFTAADSGIDTQSNSSDTGTPVCSSLPPPPPSIQNQQHLTPHQTLPISSPSVWSYIAKPAVGYSPDHSTMPTRAPGLEIANSQQVSYPIFHHQSQHPPQSSSTYIVTEHQMGIPGACPGNVENNTVCYTTTQSDVDIYGGYRHSLPHPQMYDPSAIPRPEPPYIQGMSFSQPQAVYEVNNHLISSPNGQSLGYDPASGVPLSYATHLAPQALYSPDPSQFMPKMEHEGLGNVQIAHPRLPSLSLGQPEVEQRLLSPYPSNGQPIPIPDANESWSGGVADSRHHGGSATGARTPNLTGNPNGQIQLWSFILDELENAESQDVLCWTGDGWEFRFKDPEKVAKKWGEQKNKPSMNYEKMSRGLRYYYDKDIIRKSSSGGRYHYRFTDKKMAERTHFTPNEYFRHFGITPQKEDPGK